jgi:hypothetical protein
MLRVSTRKSPRQRRTERNVSSHRQVQVNAFNDLLDIRKARNNKLKRGDVKDVIEKYRKMKLFCVTRDNLEYRLKLYEKGIAGLMSDKVLTTTTTPLSTVLPGSLVTTDDMSSLTFSNDELLTFSNDESLDEEVEENNDFFKGGRKLGSTIKAKRTNTACDNFGGHKIHRS